jgi:hypothetical protein
MRKSPLDFTLVNTTKEVQTWVFCSEEADEKKMGSKSISLAETQLI